mmetsp:Transcript_42138/g.66817  ORF Transcript_42138/g.66817 Transcript_42138/m.66817 type:complete len:132 (+) Transcript_42138:79-474(+)|eukprot:CAMPEP_0169189474 /NCGR_PEP_ID=MMETSP1016-20121227/4022_1 /TAXON_ID=342587 /ORGANISM="Karlodinium micrum, Strain CCMP2283" /LENGTH=131 /DNA_ID=CAMNT_0009265593 /DNA_START=75 /DNA_END=467 /DNA_ORIENTATION=+
MANKGVKNSKSKVKAYPDARGWRYSTADGWGAKELILFLGAFLAAILLLMLSSYFTLGNMGLAGGACGSVDIAARPGATTHQQTTGHLGEDAAPGANSKVILRDRFGEHEAEYKVPSGCYGNNMIIFYHWY